MNVKVKVKTSEGPFTNLNGLHLNNVEPKSVAPVTKIKTEYPVSANGIVDALSHAKGLVMAVKGSKEDGNHDDASQDDASQYDANHDDANLHETNHHHANLHHANLHHANHVVASVNEHVAVYSSKASQDPRSNLPKANGHEPKGVSNPRSANKYVHKPYDDKPYDGKANGANGNQPTTKGADGRSSYDKTNNHHHQLNAPSTDRVKANTAKTAVNGVVVPAKSSAPKGCASNPNPFEENRKQ
eukprot:1395472-Amorphochlora_amoeboformis.AAC.2